MNRTSCLVLAAGCALATPQVVAADADIAALRDELVQLKKAYEQRIDALERRLADAETRSQTAPAGSASSASRPATPATGAPATGAPGSFNPEIGLVLQGRARRMSDIPERSVAGYWAPGHDHDGEARGISLEHSELMLSANIDHSFRGVARFAVTPEGEVEVEEASVTAYGLGHGLSLRAGRFASEIGYQNAQHAHEWDFADATLMQQVLFGAEGYRHDGLQVKWVAPTDFMLVFGAELGRGATFPGTDRNLNGPNAVSLFGKTGGDIGASHSWQAGLSFHQTRALNREGHFEDADAGGPNEVTGLFSGRSRTVIADLVWKWAPNGNARDRNFKLQTEFFRRVEDGTLGCTTEIATSPCSGGMTLGDLRTRQTGGYVQAVYQFRPQWRIGYRYDWLGQGSKSFDAVAVYGALDAGNSYFSEHRPRRDSIMLDWSNSEFSRLRLQYARDHSQPGLVDNQWTLQYSMSLGAHGAHRF